MKNILTFFMVLFFATTAFSQDKPKQEPNKHNRQEHVESRQGPPEHVVEMWKKRREQMQKMQGSQPDFHGMRPLFNGPQHGFGGMRPPIGYMPMIMWVPQGMHMGVGPVMVSPDRRYVRFGINAGFYHMPRVHTFNYSNGR